MRFWASSRIPVGCVGGTVIPSLALMDGMDFRRAVASDQLGGISFSFCTGVGSRGFGVI